MSLKASAYRRITRPSEYRRIYDTGRKVVGRYYVMFCSPSEAGDAGLGITVSGKVGNAVVRNRARRRTREAANVVFGAAQPAADIVLVALSRITDSEFGALVEDMKRLISKVRL